AVEGELFSPRRELRSGRPSSREPLRDDKSGGNWQNERRAELQRRNLRRQPQRFQTTKVHCGPSACRLAPHACIPQKRGISPAMDLVTPCACAPLRRAARAVTAAYDAALAPSGLRITQFGILRRLARLGPLPVTRLAAESALERSTMGRNVNPLER